MYQTFVVEEDHPNAISEQEEDRLIDQAEANDWEWYYDLGDDDKSGECINLLIITDGKED